MLELMLQLLPQRFVLSDSAAHREEEVLWLEVPVHHIHGVTVLHNLHRHDKQQQHCE
jgi:hypothetical protein